MRKIAIIGAGQAGLLCAHGLLKAGYQVTLFSDRSGQDWLTKYPPTGAAARFKMSLDFERELGLNYWEDEAPKGTGVFLTFCPKPRNQLFTMAARSPHYCQALDLRLQCHRWLSEFEARGGTLEIESVTVERLDEIAAAHDLAVVAAGRADLRNLFERDAERSVYDKPQRHLAMVITTGGRMGFDGIDYLPVRFTFIPPVGEAFWVPYFHKDHGATWNLVFEARPGGPMDRFGEAKDGQKALEIGKQIIKEMAPWDWEWCKDMQLADENGWLVGRFPPTVRKPVGRLPSGRIVTPLGDTCMSLDPIGGQGANNGNKMTRNLVESIIARRDQPFDEQWMTETFEKFYRRHGHYTYTFNNLLLEKITDAAKEVLIAQYGSDGSASSPPERQALANDFFANFNDAKLMTDTYIDLVKARRYITEKTGRSWIWSALRGRTLMALKQVRQAFGLPPHHPGQP